MNNLLKEKIKKFLCITISMVIIASVCPQASIYANEDVEDNTSSEIVISEEDIDDFLLLDDELKTNTSLEVGEPEEINLENNDIEQFTDESTVEDINLTNIELNDKDIDLLPSEVDSEGTKISLEMEDTESTSTSSEVMDSEATNALSRAEDSEATSTSLEVIDSEEIDSIDNETNSEKENINLKIVNNEHISKQPTLLSEVKAFIYDYWFNNSELPKFEAEVPSVLLPSAWNCIYIENEEFNYYTLELDFEFTPQPTSINDVQSEIDKLMPDFYKPMWQFEVDDSLMPGGYSCDSVYDEELGIRYYSWFMGIKATADYVVNGTEVTINGTGILTEAIVNAIPSKSSVKSVIIGDGFTSIADEAFWNYNSLTSVTIGNSVQSIGYSAFYNCTSLESIVIPDSVTTIGNEAFSSCTKLTSVVIPDGVTSIGNQTFSGCSSLISITLPNNLISIGASAFNNCTSLTSITLPEGLMTIGNSAFNGCNKLASINIPDSIVSIGTSAFRNCSALTSIVIPESITTIGNYTFNNCGSLTSIVIPEGVITIGNEAFSGCGSLTFITIPANATSIGTNAFNNCNSLNNIYINRFSDTTDNLNNPSSTLTWNDSTSTSKIRWLRNTSFETNGGSIINNIIDYQGTIISKPNNPNKTGYTFGDWYTDETLLNKITFPYTIADNATLYAKWTINSHNLTVNQVTGGNIGNTGSKTYNSSVTLTATPATGYTFGGWQSNAYLTGTNLTFTMPDNDVELTPVFTPNDYIVTFDYQNADDNNTILSKTVTYDSEIDNLPNPTRAGYTFDGWFYNEVEYTASTVYNVDNNITLVAKWSVSSYKLTLDPNNNIDSTSESQIVYNSLIVEPTQPEYEGHSFSGWFYEDEEWLFASDKMPAKDITLVAMWDVNTYEVTFDPDNGTELDIHDVVYNGHVHEPETPTKTGYTFIGWFNDNDLWNFETDTIGSDHMVLKAKWTINSYTISFNSNGGTDVDSITQDYNTQIASQPSTTRTGYEFDGWYTESGLINKVTFPYTITNSTILYGKWNISRYIVTVSTVTGGTIIGSGSMDYNSSVTLTATPATGYTFGGWQANAYLSGTDMTFTMPANDVTLTPIWTKVDYNITLTQAPNGTVTASKTTANYQDSITLTIDVDTGYSHTGWTSLTPAGLLTSTNKTFSMPASNVAITPVFTPNNYEVAFDSDGGTIVNKQTIPYNSKIVEPNNPIKTGYSFLGWYNDFTKWSFGTDTMPASNVTLKAKWSINQHIVNFNTNGGSNVDSITQDYNTTINTTPLTTRTYYTFRGWYTENTFVTKVIFPYTITDDVALYAKWLRTSPYEPYDPLDPTNPDNLGEGEYNVIKEDSEDCEATDSLCETDGTTYYEKDNKYLIIFNPANGENKIKIEAIYKSFLTEPIYPVYLGHIFKGWYYSDNKWNFSTNTVPASSIELVAKWEVKTAYNVTFNPNNNVQSKTTIEVDEGSLISEPKQPVKLKHKFMGWYYGNKKWDFENDVMVSQDIELIAKWKYIYVNSVDNSDKEDGFLVDNKTDNNKENVIIDNIYESDNDILEDDKFIQVDSESTVVDDVVLPLDSILSDVESVSAELTDSLNKIDMNSKEIDNIDNGSIYKNIELNNYSKEEHENNRTKPYELWEIPEGYHQVEIHKDGTIYYELEEIEEYESDTVVEEYTLTMDEEKYCNWFCNSSSWLTQNCWIILIIFTLLALCLYVIIKNVKILLIVFGVISTLFLILLPCVNYIPILIVLIFILLGILFYLRKRK